MTRLSLVLPAAAAMLAGVAMTSTVQAAPASGLPEALKAAVGKVQLVHWRRHHYRHHYYRHHRRHHRHYRHW